MYCTKCGKLNDGDAGFCTACGSPLMRKTGSGSAENRSENRSENSSESRAENSSSALGIIALVAAFVFPLAGLVLGVIDYNTKDGYNKNLSKWAMIASGVILVLRIILSIVCSAVFRELFKILFETINLYT